jgi:hypothetical protein
MKFNEIKDKERTNISLPKSAKNAAVELVHQHRLDGGVSELITRLIIAEAKRKRGIAHLQALEVAK